MRAAGALLITLSIPTILVSTGVRGVALSDAFYRAEFVKYGVSRTTGLTDAQLDAVAQAFITYFQSSPGPIEVEITSEAGSQQLFNRREIDHMRDVQGIVRWFIDAWAAGGLAFALGAWLLLRDQTAGSRMIAVASAVGGAGGVLVVGALAWGTFVDFRALFLQFHFLSFANDLWILDPATDRLIQLFPLGFFFDAALQIATHIVFFGAAILLIAMLELTAGRLNPFARWVGFKLPR